MSSTTVFLHTTRLTCPEKGLLTEYNKQLSMHCSNTHLIGFVWFSMTLKYFYALSSRTFKDFQALNLRNLKNFQESLPPHSANSNRSHEFLSTFHDYLHLSHKFISTFHDQLISFTRISPFISRLPQPFIQVYLCIPQLSQPFIRVPLYVS